MSVSMPKKSRPFSYADISDSSKVRSGESLPEHPLVKDEGASLNKGGMAPSNPSAGSNKKHKKRLRLLMI